MAVQPAELGARRFRDIWNNNSSNSPAAFYLLALGRRRARKQICFECPNTVLWEDYQRHRAAGGTLKNFAIHHSNNDVVNFFWSRHPKRGARLAAARRPPGERSDSQDTASVVKTAASR